MCFQERRRNTYNYYTLPRKIHLVHHGAHVKMKNLPKWQIFITCQSTYMACHVENCKAILFTWLRGLDLNQGLKVMSLLSYRYSTPRLTRISHRGNSRQLCSTLYHGKNVGTSLLHITITSVIL